MDPIPIIRRSVFLHCTGTLERLGFSAKRVLAGAGIPNWHLGPADDWIPYSDLLRALTAGYETVGDSTFGMTVGEEFPMDFGTFGRIVTQSVSLFSACRTVVRQGKQLNSTTHFWIAESPDAIWLCRARTPSWQMEQYVLSHMIGLVKMASRNEWQPREVYVSAPRSRAFEQLEILADAKTRFGQPCTALAIPKAFLSAPLKPGPGFESAASESTLMKISPGDDFVGSLRQIVESLLRERYADIETVSEVVGVSKRKLQRELAKEGLKYRDLVGQVRYKMACKMFAETDMTAREIAHELSYSRASHLIRSFRHWSGLTPGEHREFHKQQKPN
ncbi:MAG: AraC family transcriptional regulator [Rhodospirillales bacterium]|nr:AraC family transcriptional regulator [Rhodospirillales bacterium]MDH3911380.1 AraC family transcriptional regulator [Rhodospirillales bacterium]MDH3918155.1 AraC family transcriptional regulator [Rhodospirillales bacterium]MDH3969564.1 AraC family transcriptional regulator [Rhodospirillales bacterium]